MSIIQDFIIFLLSLAASLWVSCKYSRLGRFHKAEKAFIKANGEFVKAAGRFSQSKTLDELTVNHQRCLFWSDQCKAALREMRKAQL